MIRFEGGAFLLVLALDVFCLIDVITSDEDRVRNLPKIAWFLLILFFPLIGSVAWLAAGRPDLRAGSRPGSGPEGYGSYGRAPAYPEYDRPGRATGPTPESDEEFLRKVRERADEQRRKAAEQKAAEQRQQDEGP
jgi:hypothetical protein